MKIFIGFDPREAVAYHTCVHSIIETSRDPTKLEFSPVVGPRRDGSNDFIYARFIVPELCGYRGHAIFMDGDMIVRAPIEDLYDLRRHDVGVQVVKHDYKTKHPTKYLRNKNEDYPRKNWSSVVLWNCAFYPNRLLTSDYVAKATGAHLHRFGWLKDEQIGELPDSWNRLVLEQDVQEGDQLLHYTIGTPCFQEYADCDHAEEWHAVRKRANAPC